jgi:hypothetical protein
MNIRCTDNIAPWGTAWRDRETAQDGLVKKDAG